MHYFSLRMSSLLTVLTATSSLLAQSGVYFSHPYWVTESSMTVTLTGEPPAGSVLNVYANATVANPEKTIQVGDGTSGDVISFGELTAGQDYYLRLLDGSSSVLQTRRFCTQFASWPTNQQSDPVLAAEMESFSSGTFVDNIGSSGPATFITNGLTISSETPSPMFSGSMDFQSNGDKLRIPGSTMNQYMNENGNWTISMWIRPTVVSGEQWRHSIFSWEGPDGKNMTARHGDNGRIQIVIGEPGSGEQSQTSGPLLTADKWYHFAAAYQGGDDKMRVFLDGNLILSPDFSIQIQNGWTHDFEIGGNPSFDDRSFRGQICGFTFHNNFIYPSGGLSSALDPYVRRHVGKYMNWAKPFEDGVDYYGIEDNDGTGANGVADRLALKEVSCDLEVLSSLTIEANATYAGAFPGPNASGPYDLIANPINVIYPLHDFNGDVDLEYKAVDIDGLEYSAGERRVISVNEGTVSLTVANASTTTPAEIDQIFVGGLNELELAGTFKMKEGGRVYLEPNATLRLGTFSEGDQTYTSTLNNGGQAMITAAGTDLNLIMEVPVSGTGWHGISLPFYTEDSEDPSNADFNMYLGDDLVEVNSTTAPNLYMWGDGSGPYGWNSKTADEFAFLASHPSGGLKHGAIAYFGGTGGVATGSGPWTLEMRGESLLYGNGRTLNFHDVQSSEWFASQSAEASSRWVLLGNAEMCTIGASEFLTLSNGENGTLQDILSNNLYVYDSNSQGWASATSVAPGQAFLVQGLTDATTQEGIDYWIAEHTNGAACVDNAVTFKQDIDVVALQVSGASVVGDRVAIVADDDASLGYDNKWDALQMGYANAANLFVMDEGVYLDRNHAALPLGMPVTMNLGFYSSEPGTYSISLADELMANERRVEIENPETGEFLNLSNGSFEFDYASPDELHSWVLHIDRLGHLEASDFSSDLTGESAVGIEENLGDVAQLQVTWTDGSLQLTIEGSEWGRRWMGAMFDASGKKVIDLDSQGSAQWRVALSSTLSKGLYHIKLASPGEAPLTAKAILN